MDPFGPVNGSILWPYSIQEWCGIAIETTREADARVAIDVKAMQAAGRVDGARARYGELVERHQRRAARIAFHYLRDSADADEAVQDAFVKAYTHLGTFREDLPFEVWFTRILINGCLDRIKARKRRERWIARPSIDADGVERDPTENLPSRGPSPEAIMLLNERRRRLREALTELPERQRLVFVLSHFEGQTSREVSAVTGLNESTVRVHLFRAIRRLRSLLAPGVTESDADTDAVAGEQKNQKKGRVRHASR